MCNVTLSAAIRRIVSYADEQGFTKSRLAAIAGLKDTTLRKFGQPTWNPTRRIVERIEAVVPADYSSPDCPGRNGAV